MFGSKTLIMRRHKIEFLALATSLFFTMNSASADWFGFEKSEPIVGGFIIGSTTKQQVLNYSREHSAVCHQASLGKPKEGTERFQFMKKHLGGVLSQYECDGLFPEITKNQKERQAARKTTMMFVGDKLVMLSVGISDPEKFTVLRSSLTDKYGKSQTDKVRNLLTVAYELQTSATPFKKKIPNNPRDEFDISVVEHAKGQFREKVEQKIKASGLNEILCGLTQWLDGDVKIEANSPCPVLGMKYSDFGELTYIDSNFYKKLESFGTEWKKYQSVKQQEEMRKRSDALRDVL